MRVKPALLSIAVAASTAACATGGDRADGPPDLTPAAGSPAPPRAKLYADCIAQAAAAGTYDRNSDPDTELIRFTCSGEPARVFFDALAGRSAAVGSEWTAQGRTWRSTNRVRRDLFGVDYCSAGDAGDHQCVVVLNAGEFLRE